jgi:hypothetical protein
VIVGELIGKDYILDASELREWCRILEEPIYRESGYGKPSGRELKQEDANSVSAGNEAKFIWSRYDQIPILVDSVRDLVAALTPKKQLNSTPARSPSGPARLIRLRDAPGYLGMDKNRFNAEVRPYLTEIPIGKQGRAFDKLDLDEWAGQYKTRNGRPGKKGEEKPWRERKYPVSSTGRARGTSTKLSVEEEFAKALASAKSGGRKSS